MKSVLEELLISTEIKNYKSNNILNIWTDFTNNI